MNTLTKIKNENMGHQLDAIMRGFYTALLTLKGWGVLLLAVLLASRTGHLVIFLVVVFHLDMISGIIAGRKEAKIRGDKPKVYFLESKKMRQSVVKAGFYVWFCLGVFFLTSLLHLNKITFQFSNTPFYVYEIAIVICIAIELFSIIENFKRLGFDLFAYIKKMAKQVWSVVGAVKDNKQDEN